ncbi:hypothetical protein LXA43DRAFT_992745 [Ganoderma leucocontextum]|nr:hypothetical protein LXA43DRAFT_992745 [Ganoderma leucocontextum]
MSAAHVSAQEISNLYTQVYCYYAACAILVYDWFLCLCQEVRFIWNWHSKVNSSSLVYSFSRYAVLIEALLIVATNYPMPDLVRNVTTILPSNRLIVVYAELSGKYMGPGSPQDTGHDCVQRSVRNAS